MNFSEAYDKMLDGQKVKRKAWPHWQHCYIVGKRFHITDKTLINDQLQPVVKQQPISMLGKEMLAEDWVVFTANETH